MKQLGVDKVVIIIEPEQMKAANGSIKFLINTVPNDIDFQQYVSCMERGGKLVQVGMPATNDYLKLNINGLVANEIEIIVVLLDLDNLLLKLLISVIKMMFIRLSKNIHLKNYQKLLKN